MVCSSIEILILALFDVDAILASHTASHAFAHAAIL